MQPSPKSDRVSPSGGVEPSTQEGIPATTFVGLPDHHPCVLFSRIDHRDRQWAGCQCQRCTPTLRPSTARFLVSQNGGLVTKVKVRAGERVQHWERRDNGEGVTNIVREWEFDGTTVYLAWASDGTDCDGRLQRSGSAWCDYSRLGDGYTDPEGRRWPRWEHTEGPQRDHSAEAAGY